MDLSILALFIVGDIFLKETIIFPNIELHLTKSQNRWFYQIFENILICDYLNFNTKKVDDIFLKPSINATFTNSGYFDL